MDLIDEKIAIYEAFDNGEIDALEKEILLESAEAIAKDEECMTESYSYSLEEFEMAKREIIDANLKYAKGIIEYNLKRTKKFFDDSTERARLRYMKVPNIKTLIDNGLYEKKNETRIDLYVYRIENNTKSKIQGAARACRSVVIREAKEYQVKDHERYLSDAEHHMKEIMKAVRYKQKRW
jgi:hypothetical protein